jgi:hypothetical protein
MYVVSIFIIMKRINGRKPFEHTCLSSLTLKGKICIKKEEAVTTGIIPGMTDRDEFRFHILSMGGACITKPTIIKYSREL